MPDPEDTSRTQGKHPSDESPEKREENEVWIDRQEDLDRLVDRLKLTSCVAVDTESDSFFAYAPRVCLFQFSDDQGDALVDPLADLDFSGLGELFLDESVEIILHAAENDVGLLGHEYGFKFNNVFDTMLAAQILGYKKCGLAPLLDLKFGVYVGKKYQTSNWRKRPLEEGQIAYAISDTRYLIELRNQFFRELEELGRWEEALAEFKRVSQCKWEPKAFDPEGFTRISGAKALAPQELSNLRELFLYRNGIAERSNRAAFRVFADSVLIGLAKSQPIDVEGLSRVIGLKPWKIVRHGSGLLEALDQAEKRGPIPWPKAKKTQDGRKPEPMTRLEKDLLSHFKAWRAEAAKARDVDISRIATTAMLMTLVREKPQTPSALARINGMDEWRVREYGEAILQILQDS